MSDIDELRKEVAALREQVAATQKQRAYYFPGDINDPYGIYQTKLIGRQLVGGPLNGESRVFMHHENAMFLRGGTYELRDDGKMHWKSS